MDLSPSFIAGAANPFLMHRLPLIGFMSWNYWMRLCIRCVLLSVKNRENLTKTKEQALDEMIKLYPTLGEAYRLKVLFNDLWAMPNKPATDAFMMQWCVEVDAAKIPAFMKFANTAGSHWLGIVHFVESNMTNGILEGTNSKIQLAKPWASGYRNITNFINMIYFLCGKLKFDYPLYFT